MPGTLKNHSQASQPVGNYLLFQTVPGRVRTSQPRRMPPPAVCQDTAGPRGSPAPREWSRERSPSLAPPGNTRRLATGDSLLSDLGGIRRARRRRVREQLRPPTMVVEHRREYSHGAAQRASRSAVGGGMEVAMPGGEPLSCPAILARSGAAADRFRAATSGCRPGSDHPKGPSCLQ